MYNIIHKNECPTGNTAEREAVSALPVWMWEWVKTDVSYPVHASGWPDVSQFQSGSFIVNFMQSQCTG